MQISKSNSQLCKSAQHTVDLIRSKLIQSSISAAVDSFFNDVLEWQCMPISKINVQLCKFIEGIFQFSRKFQS